MTDKSSVAENLRFPGLTSTARSFFRALDEEPCPNAWPGSDRVAYVAHVLGPFKALVSDLSRQLADVAPTIMLEPRVGASLAWPHHVAPDSADCAVRSIRAWNAASTPFRSPLLTVTFSGQTIEIALEAAGGDPDASNGLRDALLGPSESPRADAASLICSGWRVQNSSIRDPAATNDAPASNAALASNAAPASNGAPDTTTDESVPADLQVWFDASSLRVVRSLAWEPWLEEPGFALEVADRWRELLPLFHVMSAPVARLPAVKQNGRT